MAWIRRHRSALGGIVALVAAGLTFGVVLPRIADYGEVWRAFRALEGVWVAILLAAAAVNVVTHAPPWMIALPGLRFRQALPFTQASTAITYVVPGGGLVGMAGSFALLRSWGFETGVVTRAVTLTGIWNQLTNLLLPTIAAFLVAAEAETDAGLVLLAVVGGGLFSGAVLVLALVLWRRDLAEEIGDLAASLCTRALRVVRRGPARFDGRSFGSFRDDTVDLIRRRWVALSVAAVGGNLTVFLVLLLSARAVGIGTDELTWIQLFAGWAVARVLGLIPITPGGVGVVEVGLTGTLVGFGGPNAEVVAAVLLYRALTVVPSLVFGGVTFLVWRHLHPEAGREGLESAALNRLPE
jgi:uncharacterized membrane protein YbhN (UPF0104 family)